MDAREKIVETFRRKGFRATPQRIAIAQFVLRSKEHPSAEDIFSSVTINNPTISISTVYNTLNVMKEMNLVQELAFNSTRRFDPNINLHINLICESCGTILDIEDENIEETLKKLAKKKGFEVTGHRLDLYGVCKKCM